MNESKPKETNHQGVGHVMPIWILVAVWASLIFFTYITVAATYVNLGEFNLILALAIATIKASLVALFFMHLLYDHPFNGFVFVSALFFLAIFIIIALIDTSQYQPDLIPGYAPEINR